MQKTRLGISAGLMGAALYFLGFLGIIPVVLVAGYVLLFEENEWLKRTAVKAVAVLAFFAVLIAFVNLAANSRTFLIDLSNIFGDGVSLIMFNRIISICRTVISFAQTVFLLLLGFKALKQGTVKLGPVDNTINKHM